MKKLFSLLVAVLLGQNMYSQEVIYVDENGFRHFSGLNRSRHYLT